MNAGIANLISSVRESSSASTSQGLAHVVDVVHRAYASAQTASDGPRRSAFKKWMIAAAAVIAGFFLLRSLRKTMKLAFGLFWVWNLTSGTAITHRISGRHQPGRV